MVSKKTVDELLVLYLEDKGLDEDNIEAIKKNLHKDIKNEGNTKSKVSHGTSCPRLMNEYGELIVEM